MEGKSQSVVGRSAPFWPLAGQERIRGWVLSKGDGMAWSYAAVSVVLVSLLSLVGIFFLAMDTTRLRRILLILVSFAIGGRAGDAFIHLIPEAFRELGIRLHTSLLIILGMIVFFAVEKLIRWWHCHMPTSAEHVHPVAALNLVGDAVHNLIDGIVIGASYMVGVPIGRKSAISAFWSMRVSRSAKPCCSISPPR
jgi:zinc transporter ZupT